MSEPKQIVRMLTEIEGALDAFTREQLVDILTYVFKEFVVAGNLPVNNAVLPLVDARSELEGRRFAEVISWLQLHLDHPEWELFEAQGDRVRVKLAGRTHPLEVESAPAPAPVATPPTAPGMIATSVAVRAQPAAAVAPRPAPAPSQNAAPAAAPAAAAASTPAPAAAPAAASAPAKEEPAESNSRFSRLEID